MLDIADILREQLLQCRLENFHSLHLPKVEGEERLHSHLNTPKHAGHAFVDEESAMAAGRQRNYARRRERSAARGAAI